MKRYFIDLYIMTVRRVTSFKRAKDYVCVCVYKFLFIAVNSNVLQ